MSEKGLYYPVVRKIITVVVLLIVAGSFLAVYYFTYLPQEHAQYDSRIFRILHEISENFEQRVANYGTVYSNNYISKTYPDNTLHPNSFFFIVQDTGEAVQSCFLENIQGKCAYT